MLAFSPSHSGFEGMRILEQEHSPSQRPDSQARNWKLLLSQIRLPIWVFIIPKLPRNYSSPARFLILQPMSLPMRKNRNFLPLCLTPSWLSAFGLERTSPPSQLTSFQANPRLYLVFRCRIRTRNGRWDRITRDSKANRKIVPLPALTNLVCTFFFIPIFYLTGLPSELDLRQGKQLRISLTSLFLFYLYTSTRKIKNRNRKVIA